MHEEPYRWVEAMRNRRDYLEDQLQNASPVVGLRYTQGVLLLTTTPGPRKIFEVYNQIAFAAIGHPADMEKLRKVVIDIAHTEAFNLSARDINLQRLVSFGIGPLMKTAFDEIFRSPFTARVLMVELDPPNQQDVFYTIDADGSFASRQYGATVSGTAASAEGIVAQLDGAEVDDLSLEEALQRSLEAWGVGRLLGRDPEADVAAGAVRDYLGQVLPELKVEAAVLDRSINGKTKFRLLAADELDAALAAYVK